jgi:hypothetical protein
MSRSHADTQTHAVSPGPTRTEGTEAMGEGVEELAAQAPCGPSSNRRGDR